MNPNAMSPGRQHPPMNIWHDNEQDFSSFPQLVPQQNILQPHGSPNLLLAPPNAHWQAPGSPMKYSSPSSSPQLQMNAAAFDSFQFAPPELYQAAVSPSKKQAYSPASFYAMLAPAAVQQSNGSMYPPLPSAPYHQHENLNHPAMIHSDSSFRAPNDLGPNMMSSSTPSLKRHMNDAPSKDRPVKKPRVEEPQDDGPLPEPHEIPVPEDDGNKPQLSYAQLIALAILKSPDRRLTLSQIYDWIKQSFSYYLTAESGWTNSIRHNLSLNKAFVKRERPKDDPGKGNYWMIEEGMERQFLRDRVARSTLGSDPLSYVATLTSDGVRPSTAPAIGHFTLPKTSSRAPEVNNKFPVSKEISSDATVPASDDNSPKRDREDDLMPPPQAKRVKRAEPDTETDGPGSPTVEFNSSPPVVPASRHARTKSSPARFHKRHMSNGSRPKSASNYKDSGFYSSIESSAPRVSTVGPLQLTSDPDRFDRPSNKRSGRAEDEIARLRGSSYDPSPSKGRPEFKKPARYVAHVPENSSPLRPLDRLPPNPFTPGMKMAPPPSLLFVPPTVSPNTNLRLHRESVRDLVGTPAHGLLAVEENWGNSPGFNIHEDRTFEDAFNGRPTPSTSKIGSVRRPKYDTLQEQHSSLFESFSFDTWLDRGSPVKKALMASGGRPGLTRSNTTSGALEDITGKRQNVRLGSPIQILPPPKTPKATKKSPMKNPSTPPPRIEAKDLWGTDSSDEDPGSGNGVAIDLFKGFKAIGADEKENATSLSNKTAAAKVVKAARPPLSRSNTNFV